MRPLIQRVYAVAIFASVQIGPIGADTDNFGNEITVLEPTSSSTVGITDTGIDWKVQFIPTTKKSNGDLRITVALKYTGALATSDNAKEVAEQFIIIDPLDGQTWPDLDTCVTSGGMTTCTLSGTLSLGTDWSTTGFDGASAVNHRDPDGAYDFQVYFTENDLSQNQECPSVSACNSACGSENSGCATFIYSNDDCLAATSTTACNSHPCSTSGGTACGGVPLDTITLQAVSYFPCPVGKYDHDETTFVAYSTDPSPTPITSSIANRLSHASECKIRPRITCFENINNELANVQPYDQVSVSLCSVCQE